MAAPIVKTFDLADSPTLKRAWHDQHRAVGVKGPVGSGKSSWAVNRLRQNAREQKPVLIGGKWYRKRRSLVVRATYDELIKTTIPTFFEWCPKILGVYNENAKLFKMKWFDKKLNCFVEWDVFFHGLQRPEDVDKLGSFEVSDAWVNEARELPFEIIGKVNERTNRYPQKNLDDLENFPGATKPQLLLDTNAPPAKHWWPEMKKLSLTDPETMRVWSFYEQPPAMLHTISPDTGLIVLNGNNPLRENRTHLDVNYYIDLVPGQTQHYIRTQILGLDGQSFSGKPVYSDYRTALHFDPKLLGPRRGVPIWRAWDFGRHPACVFIQMYAGHVYVFDELYHPFMGADDFSDRVLLKCTSEFPGFEFFDVGDPSGDYMGQNDDNTPFLILQGKGIAIMPGQQDPGLRQESINRGLRTLVDGKPIIQVGPKCTLILEGFEGGYAYEKVKSSDESNPIYKPKPNKLCDCANPHDALQYFGTLNLSDTLYGHSSNREVEQEEEQGPYGNFLD